MYLKSGLKALEEDMMESDGVWSLSQLSVANIVSVNILRRRNMTQEVERIIQSQKKTWYELPRPEKGITNFYPYKCHVETVETCVVHSNLYGQ